MTRLFRSLVQAPPRRPPGRCPHCRRLALEPERGAEGEPSPTAGAPHRCTRCGSRYRRSFGGAWEAIDDEVVWLDDPVDPLALPPRWRLAYALRATPRRHRGVSLGRIMLAIAWLAPNLALLGKLPRDAGPLALTMAAAALLLFNLLMGLYVKSLIEVRRGRPGLEDWEIVLVGLSPFLIFLVLVGLVMIVALA